MQLSRAAAAFGVAALLFGGCYSVPSTVPNPDPWVQTAEYRVAPADVLNVTVLPEPGTTVVTVRPDGRISVELIGEVEVRGMTIPEIEQAVTALAADLVVYPDVSVALEASNSRRFHILGEVENPGSYELRADMRVLDALFAAAGPTFLAAQDSSNLVRPGVGVFEVRLAEIAEYGVDETNYPIQPGDVLHVPPNWFGRAGYSIRVFLFPISSIIDYTLRALAVDAIFGDN